jgi:hypothetical protein
MPERIRIGAIGVLIGVGITTLIFIINEVIRPACI